MTLAVLESATIDRAEAEQPETHAIGHSYLTELTKAVQRYFDLMYDCDTSRFHEVFCSTAQLHGFRDGRLVTWSAEEYKDVLEKRQSPKALGAVRADEILLMDFASTDLALLKVRVKIAAMTFVDYLIWHRVEGKWLITSKGFRLESEDNPR